MSTSSKPVIAVLSAGGDCPGINAVIYFALLAAKKAGARFVGIRNGYKGLSGESADLVNLREVDLKKAHVMTRNSVIGMNRFSLYNHPDEAAHAARLLQKAGIKYLIAIGGDDTVRSTDQLAAACDQIGFKLGIIHCPKTIDNDFPFPSQSIQTFGFDTAADVVAQTIRRIDQGAFMLTCGMGRYAGFLVAEGALRAGAQFAIVPELFTGRRISLTDLCDITSRAIDACNGKGSPIVYAEGLWEVLDKPSQNYILSGLPSLAGFQAFKSGSKLEGETTASTDAHGHNEYGNFPWFELFASMMAKTTKVKIRFKQVGYETRIEAPNDFDLALTSTIGTGAVELLLEGQSQLTVYGKRRKETGKLSFDLKTLSFDSLPRDNAKKIQIRMLDVQHPRWKALMARSAALLK